MSNRIIVDFVATAKMFFRNKAAVFWTIAFPVVLILIFGAIFSGMGESTYDLYVQDLDGTQTSNQFIQSLNQTGALNIKMVDESVDASQYIKDNSLSTFLIIPSGFQSAVASSGGGNVTLDLRVDQTSSSASVVSNVLSSVVENWNLQLAEADRTIDVQQGSIVQEGYSFVDFFLPGVIGLTIMTSAVNWMVSTHTRYRNSGLFAKLSTTPLTRWEWLLSRMLWQFVVVLISTGAILAVGMLLYDVSVIMDPISLLLIILGSAMFSALGMVIARFIKDEESADAAAAAITFPMMFLAGSFFPIESMPGYLQVVAKVLPLTYLNDGLRDSMIYGNTESALINLVIVAVIALVLMVIGVYISKWKTE